MRVVALVAFSLVAQRILGSPGVPTWVAEIYLPMALVVAYALIHHQQRWPYAGVALGIGWDLVMAEQVIGPGGIAWAATVIAVTRVGALVADRRARSWAAAGAFGVVVFLVVRELSLLPLGLASPLGIRHLLHSMLLTGAWCGIVGVVIRLNIRQRMVDYRARKLR